MFKRDSNDAGNNGSDGGDPKKLKIHVKNSYQKSELYRQFKQQQEAEKQQGGDLGNTHAKELEKALLKRTNQIIKQAKLTPWEVLREGFKNPSAESQAESGEGSSLTTDAVSHSPARTADRSSTTTDPDYTDEIQTFIADTYERNIDEAMKRYSKQNPTQSPKDTILPAAKESLGIAYKLGEQQALKLAYTELSSKNPEQRQFLEQIRQKLDQKK